MSICPSPKVVDGNGRSVAPTCNNWDQATKLSSARESWGTRGKANTGLGVHTETSSDSGDEARAADRRKRPMRSPREFRKKPVVALIDRELSMHIRLHATQGAAGMITSRHSDTYGRGSTLGISPAVMVFFLQQAQL